MNRKVIGINSGTSLDGLDIGLFEIKNIGSRYSIKSVNYKSFKFPAELARNLWNLSSGYNFSMEKLLVCDKKLAVFIANKVLIAIKRFGISQHEINLIGSHGQTIAHFPMKKVTLQIGDPSIIAAGTGICTVGDFRRADIGAGGEGAPLSPVMHRHLFGGDEAIAVLNIGGIANISYVPSERTKGNSFGFDCGPGNMLIDQLTRIHFGRRFDNKGSIAMHGKIIESLLKRLMNDSFVNALPPKSTGREYYGVQFIRKYFSSRQRKEDLICTATEFTVRAIALNIRNFVPIINRIIICGGGAENTYLRERLAENVHKTKLIDSAEFGIHSKIVECAGFALLAVMAVDRRFSDLTSTTGSRKRTILGKICYA